jgi:hypothetical protein
MNGPHQECGALTGLQKDEMISPTAAALITSAQVQPSHFMPGLLLRVPITFLSLVKSTTMTTRGGANRPFRIADQNSIFTAFK